MEPFATAVWPHARGAAPTLPAPDPLDPALVADIVRPSAPPDALDVLVARLVDTALADLDLGPAS